MQNNYTIKTQNNNIRIQKIIAEYSNFSRRTAEKLIMRGQVKLNGLIVTELGTRCTYRDEIIINGKKLIIDIKNKKYFIFNKPDNVICTSKDPRNRKKVIDYFSSFEERLFPVGRLDYHTTGLLIVTNDGNFSNKVAHPKYEIQKTYIATIIGNISQSKLNRFLKGIKLIDGFLANASFVKIMSFDHKKNQTRIKIVIKQGHNRQIRKMFNAVGTKVIELERIGIGKLFISDLPIGTFKKISKNDIDKIFE